MTAAIARPATAATSAADAAETDTADIDRVAPRPRLVAVPDSEPPWDLAWQIGPDRRPMPARLPATRPTRRPAVRPPGDPAPTRETPAPASRTGLTAPPWLRRRTRGGTTLRRRSFSRSTITNPQAPGWSDDPDVGVRPTPTSALPPIQPVTTALARAVIEVLAGCRDLEQLRVHCAPDVFAGLQNAPMLGGRHATQLLSTRLCEPSDGTTEVSAAFICSGRVRALAMRLEGLDRRWRITALDMG